MAYVLLPCDLPSWPDVQRHLSQLKTTEGGEQLIQGMAKIYDICCITLDPENSHPKDSQGRFDDLKKFIDEIMNVGERTKFFGETLPCLVSHALCLRLVKPHNGFHYSLQKEDESFTLERGFASSLLANAFFSTFPKRTPKTHPTLQDFSFSDFFRHLNQPSHQRNLKKFLEYFETLDTKTKRTIRFTRKVLDSHVLPTLPGWLCSDRPLVPLVVRNDILVKESETQLFRACPCSPTVGGDVLQTSTSEESNVFFDFPELLVTLCFVESLGESEALLIEGVTSSKLHNEENEVNMCLLDATDFSSNNRQQFEDRFLLRELNKALAAFTQPQSVRRRRTPVGESSSSSTCADLARSRRRSTEEKNDTNPVSRMNSNSSVKKASKSRSQTSKDSKKCKNCPRLPPISKTLSDESFYEAQSQRGSQVSSSVNDQNIPWCMSRPMNNSGDSKVSEWPKLPGQLGHAEIRKTKSSSMGSSRLSSMKTASQSSVEILPPIKQRGLQPLDDEYYTAEEESECSEGGRKMKRKAQLLEPPKFIATRQWSDLSRCSRTDSLGFVLDGGSDEDDLNLNQHERLEDFRKRIRRRTRHHSRRSSRSSYLSSSGSSDMEDISEDPEISIFHGHQVMRPASSEPSLLQLAEGIDPLLVPPFSLPPEAVIMSMSGRKMMVTTTTGQLKAYSYDGVNPNLPVPFKAKFRRRHHSADRQNVRRAEENFWYVPPPTRSAVTSSASSEDDSSRAPSTSSLPSKISKGDVIAEDLLCSEDGKRAVASSSWGCDRRAGDYQLKAIILWLAASMAGLPCIIFYTEQQRTLNEISTVYRKILSRHWTVGDLACEILRFCRNRLSLLHKHEVNQMLFTQILSTGVSTFSQHSLD